jgi:hypothetical protein
MQGRGEAHEDVPAEGEEKGMFCKFIFFHLMLRVQFVCSMRIDRQV